MGWSEVRHRCRTCCCCFPRVHGQEGSPPVDYLDDMPEPMLSPRARAGERNQITLSRDRVAFPACTGRRSLRPGTDPRQRLLSPRAWAGGCSLLEHLPIAGDFLACTGRRQTGTCAGLRKRCFPRVHGQETSRPGLLPALLFHAGKANTFSGLEQ